MTCEIYGIFHKSAFFWKWRYRGADGRVEVSAEEYRRFPECAAAARASGYAPRSDWTGPCALLSAQSRQPPP